MFKNREITDFKEKKIAGWGLAERPHYRYLLGIPRGRLGVLEEGRSSVMLAILGHWPVGQDSWQHKVSSLLNRLHHG